MLANDFDPDGNLDPASVVVDSGPGSGTLVDNGGGIFEYTPGFNFFGDDSFSYRVCDTDRQCDTAVVMISVTPVNDPPDCSGAYPSAGLLWPPNHAMVPVSILGVTDVDADPVTIMITGITVDESDNSIGDGNTDGDTDGIGTDVALVRAERSGGGAGREYIISFAADDGQGGTCSGSVTARVPHDQSNAAPMPEATEEAERPGDFGCEHPGNYCNAPGHSDGQTLQEQDRDRDRDSSQASQNSSSGRDKDKDKDKDKAKGSGNGKGKK